MDDWINFTYFGMIFLTNLCIDKLPKKITGAIPATKLSAVQAMSKAMKNIAQPSLRR